MRLLLASVATLAAVALAAPAFAQETAPAATPTPIAKPKPGTTAYCNTLKSATSKSACLKRVHAQAATPKSPSGSTTQKKAKKPEAPSRSTPRRKPRRPAARGRRRPSTFRRCRRRRSSAPRQIGRRCQWRDNRDSLRSPNPRESDVTHSAALMSTEELARRLGAPGLRLFDCTTYLRPRPEGGYNAESGRANYDKGHIPGSAFLDLGAELSDPRPSCASRCRRSMS
jgi:hypothetical protein